MFSEPEISKLLEFYENSQEIVFKLFKKVSISVPLSVLLLDKELRTQFPGSFIIRRRPEEEDNSIVMSEVGSLDSLGVRNNNMTGEKTETDLSNNFSVMMLESREFHHNYNVH